MEKKDAIKIINQSAKLFQQNMEGKDFLFIYRRTDEKEFKILQAQFYDYNFHHLTGTKLNSIVSSATEFYHKSLTNTLSVNDFEFADDGTTEQKLDVLLEIMNIKASAQMLGDYNGSRINLYTNKVTGNVKGCLGFVKDSRLNTYVPNTVLKEDIRKISPKPVAKVFAIFYKDRIISKYNHLCKLDRSMIFEEYKFLDEIEQLIDRENMVVDFRKHTTS